MKNHRRKKNIIHTTPKTGIKVLIKKIHQFFVVKYFTIFNKIMKGIQTIKKLIHYAEQILMIFICQLKWTLDLIHI